VCGGESWGWYVEGCCLSVGPDASSFTAVDILDHFVLYISEDMVAFLVFLFANVCSYLDQEGIFLFLLSGITIKDSKKAHKFSFRRPLLK